MIASAHSWAIARLSSSEGIPRLRRLGDGERDEWGVIAGSGRRNGKDNAEDLHSVGERRDDETAFHLSDSGKGISAERGDWERYQTVCDSGVKAEVQSKPSSGNKVRP